MAKAATKEAPRVQQVPPDNSKLIAQLRSMDPNFVRSILKDAGIVKGINREAALAHLWARDRNILANVVKLLSSAYTFSEIKPDKKGNAFKVRIISTK